MGRRPLAVGAHGNISFRPVGPKKTRAAAYVRDPDGKRREVTGYGTSKAAARAALLDNIDQRFGVGGDLTGESTLAEIAAQWIVEIDRLVADGQRAPNTGRIYRSALDAHVLPAVGALRAREATVPRLNAFIVAMRTHNGAGITKTSRTVLNGVIGHAVRCGAMSSNPVRDVARISSEPTRAARAMTPLERDTWLAKMEADVVAVRHDLPDLTRMMLATGVRIGEMLAATFADVDVGEKTIAIDWTMVRIKGRGLHRMSTKTIAGERTLHLPGWAVDVVMRRGDELGWTGPLFPASTSGRRTTVSRRGGAWRDPSNTSRSLREARDRAGFGWVTSHVFRKTCATVLDEGGMTAREIADQLGHSKVSMTQDNYLGRKAVNPGAAVALDDMFGESAE